MKLPFTVQEFMEIFREYNQWVFPFQLIFYVLAFIIIYLSVKKVSAGDRIINFILAFFWLWMGSVYHLAFFSTINKAAYLFGSFFILQAGLFLYYGVFKDKLRYKATDRPTGVTGWIFVLFALFVYPLLSYAFGHVYPFSPTFGVPCPTTIFTFGILLWSRSKVPVVILIIPFLWSLLGFSAATTLGVTEDTGLIIAGVITAGIWLFKKQHESELLVQ